MFKKAETKVQKQITIKPSVVIKSNLIAKDLGATSFSDLVEILILKEHKKGLNNESK